MLYTLKMMEQKMILFLEVRASGQSHLFPRLRNLGAKVLFLQASHPKMVLLLSCIQVAVQVYQRFVPSFVLSVAPLFFAAHARRVDPESCLVNLCQLPITWKAMNLNVFLFSSFSGSHIPV